MNKRRVIPVVVLLLFAAAVVAVWKTKPWLHEMDAGLVIASGTVDATEVSISFRTPGILRSRPVDEGSVVKSGEVLAELDAREANARLRQAQAAVQAAQARLKDLEQGYRPQQTRLARGHVVAGLQAVHLRAPQCRFRAQQIADGAFTGLITRSLDT